MRLWLNLYPQSVLQVSYEDTVNSLEPTARRLLEFLGLDFEPGVLSFFDNQRAVMTPSAEQVRQPLYTSSIGMWKRYGNSIDQLVDALGIEHTG